jgi:hypothetical protein
MNLLVLKAMIIGSAKIILQFNIVVRTLTQTEDPKFETFYWKLEEKKTIFSQYLFICYILGFVLLLIRGHVRI